MKWLNADLGGGEYALQHHETGGTSVICDNNVELFGGDKISFF